MEALGHFARELAEGSDLKSLAHILAERAASLLDDAPRADSRVGVRVYTEGPGDRCITCPRRATCPDQARCLHLEASIGTFESPRAYDIRVPIGGTPWGAVVEGVATTASPEELRGGGAGDFDTRLIPLEAGGNTIGVLGVRATPRALAEQAEALQVSTFLATASMRLFASVHTASRRFDHLLLVSDLGRKVNAILNDDLLLKQAAQDIHRTFGFPNVMIMMAEDERRDLHLRARASSYDVDKEQDTRINASEGIVGKVFLTGQTIVLEDVSRESSYVCWYPDTKSEMAVPIQNGGVVEGVLNVESDRVSAFGPSDRLVLETIANQLAIAVENARLFSMVKEREDRYRTLVESSPVAVLHLDASGRLTYANPAAAALTGYNKTQLLARGGGLEGLGTTGERERLRAAVTRGLAGEPTQDLEFHVARADGQHRWVSASLEPLQTEQGAVSGLVVAARDKTRERQLQDKLNQSEKLSAIGTLVSGVAHELNNPLAGILGFAQLLVNRPPETWARGDIEKIEENARRCQRIVENLLAFARQSRMTKRRASINVVLEGVLNLNDYQLRMDNIQVTRDFDPIVPVFPVDVNRWQQVFINLISNAHQALLQTDRSNRRIHVETRRISETIVIRVSDNGPGIPEDQQHRIFEPFFTTKEAGTGLGLGICFGIVQEHGGTIELDASTGEGTTFVIELPISEEAEYPPQLDRAKPAMPTAVGAGRHVLVVDDDPYVCDVVRRALEHHRYEVTVANDGRTARDLVESTRLDAILADVRMPGELDGISLYREVERMDQGLARRFIFMTGNLMDEHTMGALNAIAARCVEKPFDIHGLARIVNETVSEGASAS